MTRKEILGFDDKWFVFIGIPFVALMVNGIMFGNLAFYKPGLYFGSCQLVALFYTSLFWLVFREIHLWFIKRTSDDTSILKRYLTLIPLILVVYLALKLILDYTIDPLFFDKLPADFKPSRVTEVISSLLFLVLIISIYEGVHFYSIAKRLSIEKEQLVKENVQSQLEGLKNQVNPHFLFNSLNTLSNIIPDEPDRAIRFVQKLSRVYRYILEIREKKLISLKEEQEYLDAYTYLLKERFGENIQIKVNIDESHADDLIVPLSLQILLENAIKHNIISKSKPLYIDIFLNDEHKLVVKNNLQLKKQVMSSTKVGLENIKNRYRFFTDMTVDIIQSSNSFIVVLPLIHRHNITEK